jgi:purine-cytosine permease-like protein
MYSKFKENKQTNKHTHKETTMPIFVWIAIAIAILLIGGASATGIIAHPIVQAMNGPLGYAIAVGILAIVGIVVWNKTKGTKSDDDR